MAIERRHFSGAPQSLQGRQRSAAAVAQNEVEFPQPPRRNIFNTAGGLKSRDGDRCIQVVKDPPGAYGVVEDQLRGIVYIRTIGSDDDCVRFPYATPRVPFDCRPVGIQTQMRPGQIQAVTMRGIVGYIPLEEADSVARVDESPYQAAPQRGVAIAPGGAHGESEDNQLHGIRAASGAPVGREPASPPNRSI